MTAVKSWIQWILMFLTICVMGIPFLIGSLWDSLGLRIYAISTAYFRVCLRIVGVTVRSSGVEGIPGHETFIVMPNHRSYFDILALTDALYPVQVRFVAKKELGNLPMLGWCMKSAGHILIDRNNRDSAVRTMKAAGAKFAGRASIAIFPEGTRSPGHHLLRFKKGGFHLAKQAGFRILPVSISGSYEVGNRHSMNLHPGEIAVRVHPPVDPKDYATIPELTEAVRTAIISGLEDYEPAPGDTAPSRDADES